tara:strand:+ start:244 stop:795 length:552 start_codon:yes stop_codon:yes gene_type:complete
MARLAATMSDTVLDADHHLNRTMWAYQDHDAIPDAQVRAHKAYGATQDGPAPLAKVPRLQRACDMVLGHELTDEDVRTYIVRLILAAAGPLDKLHKVECCAYGVIAAVVCQPHLGPIEHLDRSAGAIHDVMLFGPQNVPNARAAFDGCWAFLEGRDIDGRVSLSAVASAPPPPPQVEQLELFA